MPRIDFPDGGWAELIDKPAPNQITEGQRRPIRDCQSKISALGMRKLNELSDAEKNGPINLAVQSIEFSQEDLDLLNHLNDLLICATVIAWSYPFPCPPAPPALLDLPGDTYDALKAATAEYLPVFAWGVDFSPSADPASPSEPSSVSAGRSGADE